MLTAMPASGVAAARHMRPAPLSSAPSFLSVPSFRTAQSLSPRRRYPALSYPETSSQDPRASVARALSSSGATVYTASRSSTDSYTGPVGCSRATGGSFLDGARGTFASMQLPMPGGQCVRQNGLGLPKEMCCPVGHALTEFQSTRAGVQYECDRCNRTVPRGSTLYGCRQCDYDVCSDCMANLKAATAPTRVIKPVPGAVPNAAATSALQGMACPRAIAQTSEQLQIQGPAQGDPISTPCDAGLAEKPTGVLRAPIQMQEAPVLGPRMNAASNAAGPVQQLAGKPAIVRALQVPARPALARPGPSALPGPARAGVPALPVPAFPATAVNPSSLAMWMMTAPAPWTAQIGAGAPVGAASNLPPTGLPVAPQVQRQTTIALNGMQRLAGVPSQEMLSLSDLRGISTDTPFSTGTFSSWIVTSSGEVQKLSEPDED